MKKLKLIGMLKLKLIHLLLYGVNDGRRFHKFQTKWLNKQNNAFIGDIITIINRLRLESNYEKVNVLDVNIRNNKLNKVLLQYLDAN